MLPAATAVAYPMSEHPPRPGRPHSPRARHHAERSAQESSRAAAFREPRRCQEPARWLLSSNRGHDGSSSDDGDSPVIGARLYETDAVSAWLPRYTARRRLAGGSTQSVRILPSWRRAGRALRSLQRTAGRGTGCRRSRPGRAARSRTPVRAHRSSGPFEGWTDRTVLHSEARRRPSCAPSRDVGYSAPRHALGLLGSSREARVAKPEADGPWVAAPAGPRRRQLSRERTADVDLCAAGCHLPAVFLSFGDSRGTSPPEYRGDARRTSRSPLWCRDTLDHPSRTRIGRTAGFRETSAGTGASPFVRRRP